ncbi:N-acetyltransferase family protein [Fulvivirgaceae bacterium BMA10]|uniref:N-acetyltransferase family protein n=1 Tax=Splendidivirga corallicola TaxID=3051826 RepID=A0ABT8KUP7_9BACT|nr:N-acetyltransferase family protein [Fulvivirgaceae bacterium BMA10]
MIIRPLIKEDWPEVARIYQEGMDTGEATFETKVPDWETWEMNHPEDRRLVAVEKDQIIGWVSLSPVSHRPVYRGVSEVTVYVDKHHWGKGVGKRLLSNIVTLSESLGIWTLQAVIFPENYTSVQLHQQYGFREVGRREKIGQRNGIWRDTVLLERRSRFVEWK